MILTKKTLIIEIHKITLSVLSTRQQFPRFKINYIYHCKNVIDSIKDINMYCTHLDEKKELIYTDIKNLPAFMVYVPVSQELGPIFQVNPRDMRSY